ncbi:TetR/AcrR family transcriptional regulator C-terminal domain-containing protein [Allobranchiibius sp. GilTou38]|uniref:TetR/AcrR family transcriptional regulator n=1 Tax=Allobranchiibius sp. GilTou38 TaxID=2815210 RepID=UPI001AA0ED87|nr:TetR/AcrR family transcriptional regulator C-terminal domain-containing protein [Allobranchiibius sp. GilTou38]MBO1766298.1 TetR/AcrR family transcriptional regulator C-terminal domain-containing protein [Allobranchiibius sp. GilTou38]
MTERRRRVRPRSQKVTLSVAAFIDVAVGLLQREGAGAITLRRVAAELQTGPASVYGHVSTMQELHELVLDRMLGTVDLRADLADEPRSRVEGILDSYATMLLDHRGLADLASGFIPHGENALALAEAVIGSLLRLGLSPGRAAWGYDLLMLRMTAAAAEQDRWRDLDGPKTDAAAAFRDADPLRYPNISRVRGHLFSGGRARSAWAVEAILAGIAHAPDPAERMSRGGPPEFSGP